jgi:hypothetical protein
MSDPQFAQNVATFILLMFIIRLQTRQNLQNHHFRLTDHHFIRILRNLQTMLPLFVLPF